MKELIGAEAYNYGKSYKRTTTEIKQLFKDWSFSNQWGLYGLALNINTPLTILKKMINCDFPDLAFCATKNPIFDTLSENEKSEYFSNFELNNFHEIRKFLGQDDQYLFLLNKTLDESTSTEELLKIGNLEVLKSEFIEGRTDSDFVIECLDNDEMSFGITAILDPLLFSVIQFAHESNYPELKWLAMKHKNCMIRKINLPAKSKYKLLGSEHESSWFLGEYSYNEFDNNLSSILFLIPLRVRIALLLQYDFNDWLSEELLTSLHLGEIYSEPKEIDLDLCLRLSHSKTNDLERIEYLQSLNYKLPRESHDLQTIFDYLTAATYIEDPSTIKLIALTNTPHAQLALKWNPNTTEEAKVIVSLQEDLLEDYPDLFDIENDMEQLILNVNDEVKITDDLKFYKLISKLK